MAEESQAHRRSLLLVGEFCDASVNSTGLYVEEMVLGLSRSVNISVLSTAISSRAKDSCVNYDEVSISKSSLIGLFRPLVITILFAIKLRRMLRDVDVLVLGTNPYWLPLLTFLLPRRLPIIIWCFDLFPKNLSTNTKTSGLLLRTLDELFAKCYSRANYVIACGRDMKFVIDKKYRPDKAHPAIYIPNWLPSYDQRVVENNVVKGASTIKLLYFGNMGRFQAIQRLVQQINAVKNNNVEFLFVGGGTHSHIVREAAATNPKIKYFGQVPMSKSAEIFASTHISLISLEPGMLGTCVPSKLYFCLQNSHPIIHFVDKGSEVDLVCEEFKCGWPADFDNLASLDSLLSQISWADIKRKTSGIKLAASAASSSASAVQEMTDTISKVKYKKSEGKNFV